MATRSSVVRLTIENAFSSALAQYVDGLNQADQATAKLAENSAALEAATDKVVQSDQQAAAASVQVTQAQQTQADSGATLKTNLLEIYAGVGLARQGFDALKGVYDNTIGKTLELGQQTRTLQNDIGATSQQAGELIYAADRVGVSFGSLNTALEAAIRGMKTGRTDGIQPTIEGLAQLADKYNAIQDPIQRTALLETAFGRSGADMAPLMQLGGAGILALGQQADATGNVLSGPAAEKVHQFDLKIIQLGEDAKGTAVQIGLALIGATDYQINYAKAQDEITAAQHAGLITQAQANQLQSENNRNFIGTNFVLADLGPKLDAYHAQQDALDLSTRNASVAQQTYNADLHEFTSMADQVTAHAQRFAEQASLDAAAAAKQAAVQSALNEVFRGGTQVSLASSASVDKLLDANAKLYQGQGQLIPAQADYNELVAESTVAHDGLTQAQQKLADSQAALSKNTDPKKQQALADAVDSAQVALYKANDAWGASTKASDAAGQHVADYTTKIGLNTQAIKDNLLTDFGQSIVNQLGKVDVGSKAYNNLYTELKLINPEMAKQFGLSSAQTAAQNLLNTAVEGGKVTAQDAAQYYAIFVAQIAAGHDPMVGLAQVSGEIATDSMPKLGASVDEVNQNSLNPAVTAVENLNSQLDYLNNRKIDFWVTEHTKSTTYQGPGGGGAAGGADFVVPPGYPGDSYPLRVQSGERVIVIPQGQQSALGHSAGGVGGVTIVQNINNELAAALAASMNRRMLLGRMNQAMV